MVSGKEYIGRDLRTKREGIFIEPVGCIEQNPFDEARSIPQ